MVDEDGGIPALQVKRSPASHVNIYSSTWTVETAMAKEGSAEGTHRSREEWPGADRAVLLTWTSIPAPGMRKLDAANLWLSAENGDVYSVLALAEHGKLEASDAYKMMLSAVIVPIPVEG